MSVGVLGEPGFDCLALRGHDNSINHKNPLAPRHFKRMPERREQTTPTFITQPAGQNAQFVQSHRLGQKKKPMKFTLECSTVGRAV